MPLAGMAAPPSTTPAREFNLESQDAAAGLRALAVQGDFQVFFPASLVEGRKINQVRGKFTAVDALEKALRGTGLQYRATADGTFVVQKQGDASVAGANTLTFVERDGDVRTIDLRRASPEMLRLADVTAKPSTAAVQQETAEKDSKDAKDAASKEETVVEVTGSRIRSLLGDQKFSPMITFTRADIERAGVSTIGELGRLIPQAYSQGSYDGIGFGGQQQGTSTTSDGSIAQATGTARSTFNLRGLGTQNTLVLVNGRRVAKTGIIRGNDANDLNGIPVSSIERVEILTDGASAIYGSDAVGGVINIIQRRDYQGTEASLTYENTLDSDTGVTTAAVSRTFVLGRGSVSVSGSYQTRNAFAATDRYFSATDDWRTLGGTSQLSSFGAGGFATGAGVIQATSGNLPGRTSPYALIPTGATGSVRPESDYITIPTANLSQYTGDRAKYVNIISPQTSRAVNLRMTYPLGEQTEIYFDSRYSDVLTEIEGMPVNFRNSMVVPADYPGNPFGVSVRLNKTFWEMDEHLQGQKDSKTNNTSVATGLTGMFGEDWRYEAGFDWNRGILRDTDAWDPVLQSDIFAAAIAPTSTNRPVLFYDSRTSAPNSMSQLLSFLRPGNKYDRDVNMGLSFSVDGTMFDLPAGAIRLAAGVERRRESAKTAQSIPESPQINLSLLGNFDRDIDSAYTEVLAPVVAQSWGIPLVNRLDLTAAIRYDRYSDAGGDYSPRYGIMWKPVSWLMVRGSRNYAFRAPNLQSLYRPVTDSTQAFGVLAGIPGQAAFLPIDRVRNNEIVNYDVGTKIGGNLALTPERSISNNVGVVLELPFAAFEGLSFSVDYIQLDYSDRISSLGTQQILDLFPERITRGAGRPGDPPGMPGLITVIDNRSFNIAEVQIRSVDYQVNYSHDTSIGTFDFRAAATVYDDYDSISLPGAAPVSSSYLYPTRYTWQSYWKRGPLGLGVSGFMQDRQYTSTARTTLRWQDATEWNTQFAYDFGAAGFTDGSGGWLSAVVANSKLMLTVFNILDKEPPHIQGRAGFAVTDPRMRRYSLTLTKTF